MNPPKGKPQCQTMAVATLDGGPMYVPVAFTVTYATAHVLLLSVTAAPDDLVPEPRRKP